MNNKLIASIICAFLFILTLGFNSFATDSLDITNAVSVKCTGIDINKITDNNISTHSGGENVRIEIISNTPLRGIYVKYNRIPSSGKLNGKADIAANGFMHEFIPLNSNTSAVLDYSETDICDIQVFSEGNLPNYVQIWEKGVPETDLLLCATHSDDDQLFFAGLLPYYAKVKKVNVRVAYFVNHFDTHNRTHELLDGLWHCGVRNYPDISPFPDGYSENTDQAERYLKNNGFEYSDILEFQKSLINKYKPLIVVLHDFNGEYGHGAHMLNTKSFIEACESNTDNGFIPEKIYVHLYGENRITLPVDEPHEALASKTPFHISQEAFKFHKSQHWTWFYSWIYGKNNNITKASQITRYSPAEYGLYFSGVGPDIQKNNMLENIITYSKREEIKIAAAEEKARIEREYSEKQAMLYKEELKLDKEIKMVHKKIKAAHITFSILVSITALLILFSIIKLKKKR